MNILEFLLALEEASIKGPLRNRLGQMRIFFDDEAQLTPELCAAGHALKPKLAPMCKTLRQCGYEDDSDIEETTREEVR